MKTPEEAWAMVTAGNPPIAAMRNIQADVLLSIADEMDKDAQEFENSPDPIKTGQFFALSRTADHYRDKASVLLGFRAP